MAPHTMATECSYGPVKPGFAATGIRNNIERLRPSVWLITQQFLNCAISHFEIGNGFDSSWYLCSPLCYVSIINPIRCISDRRREILKWPSSGAGGSNSEDFDPYPQPKVIKCTGFFYESSNKFSPETTQRVYKDGYVWFVRVYIAGLFGDLPTLGVGLSQSLHVAFWGFCWLHLHFAVGLGPYLPALCQMSSRD